MRPCGSVLQTRNAVLRLAMGIRCGVGAGSRVKSDGRGWTTLGTRQMASGVMEWAVVLWRNYRSGRKNVR